MTSDPADEAAEHESRVSVQLGGLSVETQGDTLAEAEGAFYRIWEHVSHDAEEMSAAMRERLGGFE
ncbi:hypothetical protein [Halocatena halophila]|uniref:hypothetical protein n=1 Tax=Halocatena halophila TaxID=2814576 RepID=UPI002ED57A04